MYFVYILKSLKDERHYIGYTLNLEKRLIEHNRAKNRSLKGRGPFQVVYQEAIGSRLEAVRRERQIKSYKGGAAFKELIGQTHDPIV